MTLPCLIHRKTCLGAKARYLPIEDTNDAVLTGEGDHAVVWGPGGLDFTEAADLRREAENLSCTKEHD